MKKLLMLFAVMVILTACESKSGKISKNDDFLNPTPKEETKSDRIKVIDGGGWNVFCIVEVDGHQYLCNSSHGGIVHLESCPCKTK